MSSLLFVLAIIPVVIILTYIYLKDRNKEPWSLLIKLFVLGVASCFLVLFVSELLFKVFPFMSKDTAYMTFFETMAYSFIGVALVEEFCKWLMTFLGAYNHKAYDEVYDGIVYSVYVSLGFACLENILYVFMNNSIAVGISRGILSVPGHACDAVFMGYYLSLAKVYASQGKKSLEKKNLVLSVLVPTILHGIYDFCLFANMDILLLVFFVFVITIYVFAIKKIKLLAAQCKNTPVQNTQPVQNIQPNQQQYFDNNYQQTQTNSYMGQPQYAGAGYVNQQQYSNSGYVNQQQYSNSGYVNNQQYANSGYINPQQYSNNGYVSQPVQNNYCAGCGTPMQGNTCPNCGARQN